jgi:hypothetical protein
MGRKILWAQDELNKMPKTIGEAIQLNERYFYTNKICAKNHLAPRHSDSGKCVECRRENSRKTAAKSRRRIKDVNDPIITRDYIIGEIKHGLSRSLEMQLFITAKRRAAKKNVEFTIKVTDIKIPDFCPILNIKLDKIWGSKIQNNFNRSNKASLDRIDPRLGYLPKNILVVSYRANMIKGDGFPDEHRNIAKFLKKYGL